MPVACAGGPVRPAGEGEGGGVGCEVCEPDGGELFGLVCVAEELGSEEPCVERVPDLLYLLD